MAKNEDGAFVQFGGSLQPLGLLEIQNLGKDGELYHCRVLNNAKPITGRLSAPTEQAALSLGEAVIKDIVSRIDGSDKGKRLVITMGA